LTRVLRSIPDGVKWTLLWLILIVVTFILQSQNDADEL
jgi:hypothetical protein